MQVFRKLEDIPADLGLTVATVGNFDGIHLAHQAVLRAIATSARQRNARSLLVTFDPHPMRILRPDAAPQLLTPLPEKLRLLRDTGVDAVLVLPFSRDLSLLSPREFAAQILVQKLRACEVHEGFNFRFGRDAQGDIAALEQLGKEFGFAVKIYPEMRVRGDVVSSSRIRALLREGRVARARRLLGRWFRIVNLPGRGRGYGHKYTVPTINLSRYDELTPLDGVYVTGTRIHGEQFQSVTNVGMRPTFGGDSFAIETHLLHFHPITITAETEVEVSFLYRLRNEIKFPSVEALRQQIGRDVQRTEHYFRMTARDPDE